MDSKEKLISMLTRIDALFCDIGNEATEDGCNLLSIDYIPALRNEVLNEIKSLEDVYVIAEDKEDGMRFEGTIVQFRDRFFSNAWDYEMMQDWAKKNGWVVTVKKASYIKSLDA